MKIPKVNYCCCGCSLYKGTMIIAVLATVSLLISIVNILLGSQGSESVFQAAVAVLSGANISTPANATEIDDTSAVLQPLFHYVDAVMVVHAIIAIALSLLLIYGAIKRSPAHILPWLVTETMLSVSAFVTYIVLSVFVITQMSTFFGVMMLLASLLNSALKWYYLVVVYSFYLETKSPPQYGDSRHVNYKV